LTFPDRFDRPTDRLKVPINLNLIGLIASFLCCIASLDNGTERLQSFILIGDIPTLTLLRCLPPTASSNRYLPIIQYRAAVSSK
jgi:hypothetical protein